MQGRALLANSMMTPEKTAERDAFRSIYQEHFGFVWRMLRRLGVHDEAVDDAVHEVFIVAARRLNEFEGRASMRTWLYSIVLRVASEARRAQSRLARRHAALAAGWVSTPVEQPDEGVLRREAHERLCRILDRMDEDDRRLFVLSELEGIKGTELAEILQMRPSTLYDRIHAVRARFDKLVREEEAR